MSYSIANYTDPQTIEESTGGKNLHMTHLDELILASESPKDFTATTNFLKSVVELLHGRSTKKSAITTKWDGAPAIFCGLDPADSKFFVGTKAVFNKVPKLIKTELDLDLFGFKGDLKTKLLIALKELPKLNIPRGIVLQGDMLFTTGDITDKNIDGLDYITFQPNTIMYAVPVKSDLAKQMRRSKLGMIFHTTYTGTTLQGMKASFGADVSKLNRIKSVWFDDAEYKNFSNILFSASEFVKLSDDIKKIEKLEVNITGKNSKQYQEYHLIQRNLKSSELGAGLMTFFNSQIRKGSTVRRGKLAVLDYFNHVESHFNDKVIAKVKSEKGKTQKTERRDQILSSLKNLRPLIIDIVNFTTAVSNIKDRIIRKLESGVNKEIKNFVVDKTGIRVTNPEGFVAIDKLTGGAVKFVDRLEFSNLNFNVDKKWSK